MLRIRKTLAVATQAAGLPVQGSSTRAIFGFPKKEKGASVLELYKKVRDLHETVLSPLNSKVLGPLEKASEQIVPMPMVRRERGRGRREPAEG